MPGLRADTGRGESLVQNSVLQMLEGPADNLVGVVHCRLEI